MPCTRIPWLVCLLIGVAIGGCGIGDKLAASSGACGGPPADPGPDGCALVCRSVVPVRFVDNTPMVDVWINDRPAELILDTGAAFTAISPTVAASLGLAPEAASGEVYGIGGNQARRMVTAATLAFGAVRLEGRKLDVVAFGHFTVPPGGTLGTDILSGYEVELDFPHQAARLYEGRACDGPPPGWTSGGSVVPFGSRFRGHQPVVPVELDGTRVQAVIDSGAAESGVSTNFARRAHVSEAEMQSELATLSVGVGPGSARGRLHQFRSLAIGGETLPDFEAEVLDLPLRGTDMLLGENFLRQHKVWISYGSKEVRIASDW